MNQAKEILESMSDRFATTTNVKQVFGEPIQANGITIVPVARIHYRLGGGWGGGEQQGGGRGDGPRAGGGGGGVVTARPVGALEISNSGVRFLHFFDPLDIAKTCVGGMIAIFLVRRLLRRRK